VNWRVLWDVNWIYFNYLLRVGVRIQQSKIIHHEISALCDFPLSQSRTATQLLNLRFETRDLDLRLPELSRLDAIQIKQALVVSHYLPIFIVHSLEHLLLHLSQVALTVEQVLELFDLFGEEL
jgi:hypothetical protein